MLSDPSQPLRCKSLQFVYTDLKTGSITQKQQFDFTDATADPVPDSEFTLEAYGIPEPTDIDARPLPSFYGWKFWTTIGISCFVLMFAFRRLARRRQDRTSGV